MIICGKRKNKRKQDLREGSGSRTFVIITLWELFPTPIALIAA